ncbi:hypothetical protein O6H91_15G022600 [Diphasiastrum complanatum]|nr:hypothetical protein O6H91_15G022600 [Diphasiastrum complanatum]
MRAGLTLSELHNEYPALFQALVVALGSLDEDSFMAAVTALSELISAVDLLPGREAAVQATVSAILAQKWYLPTAFNGLQDLDNLASSNKRNLAFCSLVSALGCAEASFLCRGGGQETLLLDWLVEASSGGWGLGLEGAAMAAEVWPRLAAIHPSKRKGALQKKHFAGAAQGIMKVAMYPFDFDVWESSTVEEEDFYRFRYCIAEDALAACFQELGSTFVALISDQIHGAKTWQQAEVSIFVTTCLSDKILIAVGSEHLQPYPTYQEEHATIKTFLAGLFNGSPQSPSILEAVSSMWPHGRLVETTAKALNNYALWISLDKGTLENAVNYSVRALYVPDARGAAAKALRNLCQAAAPHLAAAQALAPLMGACERAVSASMGVSKGLEVSESIDIVQGLAAVAAALPTGEAEIALSHLTVSAVATVKELAGLQEKTEKPRNALIMALKVVAAVVEYGVVSQGIRVHPALPILQDIWPALETVAGHWASDVLVITSLCELWGVSASNVGIMITGILPKIVFAVSDMFKQHLVAPCLDCLSSIVLLVSSEAKTGPEITECLSYALLAVTSTMETLEHMIEGSASSKDQVSVPRKIKQATEQLQDKALESLSAICGLGRSFLHSAPSLFLPSPAFTSVIRCAIACLRRADLNPAAARFLSEAIVCGSLDDNELKGNMSWQLPIELVPLVDQAIAFSGALIVEVVLETIARCQLTVVLRELLADVLYGLCVRFAAATESAIFSTLSSSQFPAKPGVLSDTDKKSFVAAAVRQPPHPRRRFRELVGDFAQVCQALVPAEVLSEY